MNLTIFPSQYSRSDGAYIRMISDSEWILGFADRDQYYWFPKENEWKKVYVGFSGFQLISLPYNSAMELLFSISLPVLESKFDEENIITSPLFRLSKFDVE